MKKLIKVVKDFWEQQRMRRFIARVNHFERDVYRRLDKMQKEGKQ